jgi:predicted NodU family carbamoyl transferase
MRILGLSAGSHSCGISLIENGKIIFSLEEERHTRVKVYKDF